ncbi:MAG: hypothetical protein ACREA9_02260 [Pyrinomonadaceae bacterium]
MKSAKSAFALLCILSSLGFPGLLQDCEAQKKSPASSEYDYYSLAISSISNSAAEASKLPDIPERVKLLIYVATLLPASEHKGAIRLLEVALNDLKEWFSQEKTTGVQRHEALTLRNQVLAAYARLDAEKAAALQKEYSFETETKKGSGEFSLKQNDWLAQLIKRRTIADQPAQMAFALLDTDPERAVQLAARSLQEGIVSDVLCNFVKTLMKSRNRTLLNRFENAAGEIITQNLTLDPFSLPCAAEIVQSDRDMPAAARSQFVGFFMRSLRNVSNVLREPGIDAGYIRAVFTNFTLNVRPVILKDAPEQLLAFDVLLDQVAPLVSEKVRTNLQAFQPEKFAEPRDRLAEILKDPNPERRDIRLVRHVSELLRREGADAQENFDLAADAIGGFSDPDVKSAYTDRLAITRIAALVKQRKFIEAQQLAGSLSSEETRAWALLALSAVAAKVDKVLGFELISNALKALDTASPSPHKVELALMAAAMLAKNDPQRAFDTFLVASKYANSSAAKVDPPAKPPVAFGLEVAIGEAHTKLGVYPETLGEVEIDPSLSALSIIDWFRAESILSNIREPSLRLRLSLQFAGAVLAQDSNSRRKQTTPKPSVKN